MTQLLVIFAIIIAIVVVVILLRKKKVETIENRVFKLDDAFVTELGVRIRKEPGVSVPLSACIAIEQGIQATQKRTRRKYGTSLNLTDYIVAVVRGERDSDGNPSYGLPAGPYAGSEYDKGGYILVAGQMLTAGAPYGNIIVLPEHTDNFEHMQRAAEYEAEHVELAWWDGDEFEATKIHGQGKGHPIIPE